MGARSESPRYEQAQTRLTDDAYRWLYNQEAFQGKSISRVLSEIVESAKGASK